MDYLGAKYVLPCSHSTTEAFIQLALSGRNLLSLSVNPLGQRAKSSQVAAISLNLVGLPLHPQVEVFPHLESDLQRLMVS